MLNAEELITQFEYYFEEENRIALIDWHKASVGGKQKFVIFVIRRSYVLALAMEKITGFKMTEGSKKYLTDGAAVNYCKYFAEDYLKYGYFPKILLVDDILEYGRNINEVLKTLMLGIKEAFLNNGIVKNDDEIYRALSEAVTVNVLARVEKNSLILDYFRNNINAIVTVTPFEKHKLSSSIGMFVSATDIANASYIFTSRIRKDIIPCDIESLNIKYQGVHEKIYIRYLQNDSRVKAIITLRILKARGTARFRAIPFVILPDLSMEEYRGLVDRISDRIDSIKYKYLNKYIFSNEHYSERTINEWMLMILSNAILNEYREKKLIEQEDIREDIIDEAVKLGRNYYIKDFKSKDALIEMVENPPISTIIELEQILNDVIGESYLFSYKGFKGTVGVERVKTRIENLFYNFEIKDTRDMYWASINNVYMDQPLPQKYRRKFSDIMGLIADDLSCEESTYMTAYLLHMMDGGFINASANNQKQVEGELYNIQSVKVSEQSQVIFPLRLHQYIPMMVDAWWYCKIHKLDFESHMKEFGASYICDNRISEQIEQINALSKLLLSIGETPDDIDINYFGRTEEYDDSDDFASKINRLMSIEESNRIRENYREFRIQKS